MKVVAGWRKRIAEGGAGLADVRQDYALKSESARGRAGDVRNGPTTHSETARDPLYHLQPPFIITLHLPPAPNTPTPPKRQFQLKCTVLDQAHLSPHASNAWRAVDIMEHV